MPHKPISNRSLEGGQQPPAVNNTHPRLLMPFFTAAHAMSISPKSLRNLVNEEKIPLVKVGRRSYVRTADLLAFVASLPATKRGGGAR